MEQRICSYCGNPLEPGTGTMFVKRDGSTFLFDTKRCKAGLLKLRRVPRYVKWTRHYPRGGAEAAEEALAKASAKQAVKIAEHEDEIKEGAPEAAKPAKAAAKKAEPKKAEAKKSG
jgi:large subunit ribosomal protein L24e